jgi:hypothetical protein
VLSSLLLIEHISKEKIVGKDSNSAKRNNEKKKPQRSLKEKRLDKKANAKMGTDTHIGK